MTNALTQLKQEYLLALLTGVVVVGITAVPPLRDREIRVLGFVYGIEMEVPEPHSSLKLNVCFLGEKIFSRDVEEADDVEGVGQHLEERDLAEGGWRDAFLERAILTTVEVCNEFTTWKLNKSQKRILRGIGFGIFTHGQIFQHLDRHLIGALVERWRSETNTFHFPLGEMTITLEDVGFILGLPVTGRPVIAPPPEATNKRTARDFFTSIPQEQFSRGGINLKWLVDTYKVLPENYTGEMLVLYTQAFLLWVMGAILFPTTSKNTVSVKYLPLLGNLREVGDYAWGAAVLSYLYRALHKATRPDSKAICACLSLLQVWSYEHLATGAPTRRDGTDKVWPRLCAWEYSRKESHYQRRVDPHHNITFYRGEFDCLSPVQMRWAPYSRLARRVGESFVFTLSGLQRTPLIHFEVAEWQLPDRAMRHFDCL
ncbi:hypothetical protein RJ640_024443 [Escallonia rubra]|uniref:Aminotransferase-like plant mobile domain-containing protein n=1 Tax=Escallonia rubra TaxID=112253 RepID=A0AA88RRH3_9ASTE|nr:hypothetical protein RJ640_024443 [Escallonia rubra]